jgi:acyl-CoA synthetase (AMP-forming)/AMP-acid ligase II
MLKKVMNLGRLLADVADRHPNEPGVIIGGQIWTWGKIDARVNAAVQALRALGVKKGDKLLVHSRNNLPIFESAFIAFKLGVVWVPTNFRVTPPEAAYLGQSSGACVMLYDGGFDANVDAVRAASPALQHVIALGTPRAGERHYETLLAENAGAPAFEQEVEYEDPLWFFYTSGTTGIRRRACCRTDRWRSSSPITWPT